MIQGLPWRICGSKTGKRRFRPVFFSRENVPHSTRTAALHFLFVMSGVINPVLSRPRHESEKSTPTRDCRILAGICLGKPGCGRSLARRLCHEAKDLPFTAAWPPAKGRTNKETTRKRASALRLSNNFKAKKALRSNGIQKNRLENQNVGL